MKFYESAFGLKKNTMIVRQKIYNIILTESNCTKKKTKHTKNKKIGIYILSNCKIVP